MGSRTYLSKLIGLAEPIEPMLMASLNLESTFYFSISNFLRLSIEYWILSYHRILLIKTRLLFFLSATSLLETLQVESPKERKELKEGDTSGIKTKFRYHNGAINSRVY